MAEGKAADIRYARYSGDDVMWGWLLILATAASAVIAIFGDPISAQSPPAPAEQVKALNYKLGQMQQNLDAVYLALARTEATAERLAHENEGWKVYAKPLYETPAPQTRPRDAAPPVSGGETPIPPGTVQKTPITLPHSEPAK